MTIPQTVHSHEHDDGHEVEIEYDEHIWTSPVTGYEADGDSGRRASGGRPGRAADYRAGADAYVEKLRLLTERYGK